MYERSGEAGGVLGEESSKAGSVSAMADKNGSWGEETMESAKSRSDYTINQRPPAKDGTTSPTLDLADIIHLCMYPAD
jgi:hypothetical protein